MWQGIVQNFKLTNSGFVVHTKLLFPNFIRCNIQWNLEKQPRSGHLTFHQSLTQTRTSKLFRNNFVSENFSYSRRLSIRIAENLYSLLSNTYFFLIDFRCSTAVPFHSILSFSHRSKRTHTHSLNSLPLLMSDEVQRRQRHNLIVTTAADRSPKQEHDWRVWVLSLCSSEVYDQMFTITNY